MKIPATPTNSHAADSPPAAKQPTVSAQQAITTTDLSQGRLLKGEIMATNTDGTVRIALDGKSVTAQSLVPLTVGQEIWFEVIKEGDVPLLGVAARKGAALTVMRQLLGLGGLTNLENLAKIVPENQQPVQQFASLFQESLQGQDADPGKLLKTLSLLGLFKQNRDSSAEKVTDPANKTLNSLSKIFESHAQLNSQPAGQNQQDFLLFPCFFAGNCGWGEWMVNLDDGEDSSQRDQGRYGLTFFLNMSNLGEVHINVQTKENALQGIFSLADEKSLAFLNENIPELSSLLEKLGYQPVNLSSQLSSATNFQNLKDALSQQTGNPTFALLDTTI